MNRTARTRARPHQRQGAEDDGDDQAGHRDGRAAAGAAGSSTAGPVIRAGPGAPGEARPA